MHRANLVPRSGSKFLKEWMNFLEDKADLRYPDLDDVLQQE
jgi:DNA polymerase alpha-associated DNA helicase A